MKQNNSFAGNLIRGLQGRANKLMHNPYRKINLSRLDLVRYKHLQSKKIRSHTLFGKKIFFVSAPEFLYGMTEIFLEEIYKQKLSNDPVIIDCGANIGLSVIYMKQLYPNAEIVAFEPDELNYALLEKNIKSFGYANVKPQKQAVWIENTVLDFAGAGSMSSKIDLEKSNNSVEVIAVRLKDFINRRIDFLKIDIEGAEFAVVNDISDNLHFVEKMFLEYHGLFSQNNELNRLLAIIVDKGFSYYIKEAISVFDRPFELRKKQNVQYDIQLNIFCFREKP